MKVDEEWVPLRICSDKYPFLGHQTVHFIPHDNICLFQNLDSDQLSFGTGPPPIRTWGRRKRRRRRRKKR